jgi:N-dimethylarginine dimethylaminohydrolase
MLDEKKKDLTKEAKYNEINVVVCEAVWLGCIFVDFEKKTYMLMKALT